MKSCVIICNPHQIITTFYATVVMCYSLGSFSWIRSQTNINFIVLFYNSTKVVVISDQGTQYYKIKEKRSLNFLITVFSGLEKQIQNLSCRMLQGIVVVTDVKIMYCFQIMLYSFYSQVCQHWYMQYCFHYSFHFQSFEFC